MDCFNCPKPECDYDEITPEERKAQDSRDRFALYDRKYGRNKVVWDYQHSEKGKETARRYNSSEKGKASRKRYEQSDKGKETAKRKRENQVISGKNAEYCRAYYQRKKLKKMEGL